MENIAIECISAETMITKYGVKMDIVVEETMAGEATVMLSATHKADTAVG